MSQKVNLYIGLVGRFYKQHLFNKPTIEHVISNTPLLALNGVPMKQMLKYIPTSTHLIYTKNAIPIFAIANDDGWSAR